MTPRAGEFAPNEEVDELEWLRPAAAVARLDYEHDRMLIAELPHPGAA
jgi:8-oxo-dGTP diphosphatase